MDSPINLPTRLVWATRFGEFLWTGGLTLLVWPACVGLRQVVSLNQAEVWVGAFAFHAALLINDPHFAVTYLLFYRKIKKKLSAEFFDSQWLRLRYVFAGFLAPVALLAWGILAILSAQPLQLGVLFQLMFLLVNWHYVKQGFGVFVVLSARQHVHFTQRERQLVLAHCFAGAFYAWSKRGALGGPLIEKGVIYESLPQTPLLERAGLILFILSTLALLIALGSIRRRLGRLPPIGPLLGMLISVWLWTIYSAIDPLLLFLIPLLHSLQYLYFVHLLANNEARAEALPPLFKAPRSKLLWLGFSSIALGWLLMRGVGNGLDGLLVTSDTRRVSQETWNLGATPYLALVVTAVNLHHYFMDNVLWRRQNPEMQALFADNP